MTGTYDFDNVRKFSIATSKRRTYAHLQIWDPDEEVCPQSNCIFHGYFNIIHAMRMIVSAKSTVVPDVNSRKGIQRKL